MTKQMDYQVLQNSLALPCGAILKNRMAKSAMSDSLGDGKGNPTESQIRLYLRWALGGAAISFIGEVQGDPRYPEKPGNLVLGAHSNESKLRNFTRRAVRDDTHLWPQLGHAGALSHLPISQPKGPSALDLDGLQCGELSLYEIEQLPAMYARAAAFAKSVGFTGVHIHAGHGFLLSQFLSPLFNHRQDAYGGSIEGRARLLLEVIAAVRQAVGPSLPIGVRINSTDQLEGGLSETEALQLVRSLDQTSIDLIDVSGGTYFPGAKASSDSGGKGPYFLDFARQAKQLTRIPVMLTGGFKQREQAVDAISSGAADVIGLARAMVLKPNLPTAWLTEQGGDPVAPRFKETPPGGVTAWYTMRLTAIGEDMEDFFDMDLPTAIALYEMRDDERCQLWTATFGTSAGDRDDG